ncbi:MAG: Rab family GTPase [Promethearchaeota archaeon]
MCIVGDPGVGKTSFLLKYSRNVFHENYMPTLGSGFVLKEEKLNGTKIVFNLYLWDIGGDDSFIHLRPYYIRGSKGAFICFDLTKEKGFKSVDKWLKVIRKIESKNIPIIVVGTKLDGEQKVNDKIVQIYCENKNLIYMKTSSKDGTNIRETVVKMMELLVDSMS